MAFVDTLRGDGEQISDAVSHFLRSMLSSRHETALVLHAHGYADLESRVLDSRSNLPTC